MDKDFICALCLQFETDYPEDDYFVSTECGHVYHHRCITYSYETGYRECPVDRNAIDILKLRRLYASEIRGKRNLPTSSQQEPSALSDSLNVTADVEYDYKFKIILVGDSAVGKSCLLQRYTDDVFSPTVFATVGCDWRTKTINIGGKLINLSIWDTVGQEKYRSLISNYVREAHGCLLVYDITQPESIEHIEDWYSYVKKFALSDTVAIMIGNKTDLDEHRAISKETGKKLAAKLEIPFFETSAKDTYNVDAAFRCLAANVLDNRNLIKAVEFKMKNPSIQLNRRTKDMVDEHLMRNVCSHSWHFTKVGFTGAVRNVKAGWDFVTRNRSSSGNYET